MLGEEKLGRPHGDASTRPGLAEEKLNYDAHRTGTAEDC